LTRITVLNGNPDAGTAAFDQYLEQLSSELAAGGHEVTVFELT
jgi:hypothetical protein